MKRHKELLANAYRTLSLLSFIVVAQGCGMSMGDGSQGLGRLNPSASGGIVDGAVEGDWLCPYHANVTGQEASVSGYGQYSVCVKNGDDAVLKVKYGYPAAEPICLIPMRDRAGYLPEYVSVTMNDGSVKIPYACGSFKNGEMDVTTFAKSLLGPKVQFNALTIVRQNQLSAFLGGYDVPRSYGVIKNSAE